MTVYLIFSSGGPSLQYTGGHTGRWLETPIFAPEVERCGSLVTGEQGRRPEL